MRPPAASASAHGDHLLAAAASSASAACTHECQAVSQPVGKAYWPGMALARHGTGPRPIESGPFFEIAWARRRRRRRPVAAACCMMATRHLGFSRSRGGLRGDGRLIRCQLPVHAARRNMPCCTTVQHVTVDSLAASCPSTRVATQSVAYCTSHVATPYNRTLQPLANPLRTLLPVAWCPVRVASRLAARQHATDLRACTQGRARSASHAVHCVLPVVRRTLGVAAAMALKPDGSPRPCSLCEAPMCARHPPC